jgi:hypothetical protein
MTDDIARKASEALRYVLSPFENYSDDAAKGGSMNKPLTREEWLTYLDTTWKKCLADAWQKEWDGMNRDNIIRMAREAGCIPVRHPEYDNDVQVFATPDELERFADLVAAAEREHMISDGWRQCAEGQRTSQFCAVAEQARREEREACAKECEHTAVRMGSEWMAHHCAAAIRARGQA